MKRPSKPSKIHRIASVISYTSEIINPTIIKKTPLPIGLSRKLQYLAMYSGFTLNSAKIKSAINGGNTKILVTTNGNVTLIVSAVT